LIPEFIQEVEPIDRVHGRVAIEIGEHGEWGSQCGETL
jgi:hypothetical protein